jgi:hypothetical protein
VLAESTERHTALVTVALYGCGVVYYSNRCSLLLNAFECICAHYNAFSCIFSAFCVCCIIGFVAFSCILYPLCLHSLLLHSSISRCVHFDAFSDLLHFGYDAFYRIIMHSQSPLHLGAFVMWCIRNVEYLDAL